MFVSTICLYPQPAFTHNLPLPTTCLYPQSAFTHNPGTTKPNTHRHLKKPAHIACLQCHLSPDRLTVFLEFGHITKRCKQGRRAGSMSGLFLEGNVRNGQKMSPLISLSSLNSRRLLPLLND